EGALEGRALCRVAGERVAVLELLGGITEIDRAERAAVDPQCERVFPHRGDRRSCAVADGEPGVVAAADDTVADTELALAEREPLVAEVAGASEEDSRGIVEFAYVAAPVGEHRRPIEVVSGKLPPILEQPPLPGGRVVVRGPAAPPR